jgi:Rhs element Vgr protein
MTATENTRSIPSERAKSAATYSLLSDGEAVPRTVQLLAVGTTRDVGRIPMATLVIVDGEPSQETFAVSDGAAFEPGKEIEIKLGYRASEQTVFKGLVMRQSIKVRDGGSVLAVDLKDAAEKMARTRHSRYFQDVTDSDVLEELIDAHGLDKDIEATSHQHTSLVQHDATDWDMALCRAEAAGKLVFVEDGKVLIKAPNLSADAALVIQFGATVHELDASIDARLQLASVGGTTWNAADQAVNDSLTAADPGVPEAGNLDAATLAGVFGDADCTLVHGAPLPDGEVQSWLDGKLLRHRLAKVRGRVTVDGTADVKPGDFIELRGVGARFEGKLFVTGVAHRFEEGAWKTSFQFGLDPEWFASRFDVQSPPAGGLLPAIRGLQVGVVVALEGDPDDEERIRVRIPVIHAADDGAWCRLATLDAGSSRGTWFRPEIGDEVVVGFLDSDPRHAVVLGQLHSSAKASPEPPSDDNHVKGYQSREGLRVTFDDENKVIVIETPAGNSLTLSEADTKLEIADQNDNKITLDADGIKLSSAKDIVLEATGDVKVNATGKLEAEGTQSAKIASGSGCELSLSGTADLSGPMVNIN